MSPSFRIIAETAFSHEGDFDYLRQQILAAAEGGADYVKLQVLLDPENYYVSGHPSLALMSKWTFSEQCWTAAIEQARDCRLRVVGLPLTVRSFDFCDRHCDMIEVHSVSFHERPLLMRVRDCRRPVVLGIGGRTADEISKVVHFLDRPHDAIILMVGFQAFPTCPSDLNLLRIRNLVRLFPCECGFADHTEFSRPYYHLTTAAYTLGCRWFEKHLVLTAGDERTDYQSGVTANEFVAFRQCLQELEDAIGDGDVFRLSSSESDYRQREKVLVTGCDIASGDAISADSLVYRVCPAGPERAEVLEWGDVCNRKAARPIPANTRITRADTVV